MQFRVDAFAHWTFCLLIAAWCLPGDQTASAAVYAWNGSQSSDWQNSANWSGGAVPDFDGPPSGETWGHRLEVNQGASNNELVYDSSLGTTVYASPSGVPNQGRGLIMGNGATGAMKITGGTFSTRGSGSSDLVGHQSSGTGTLTIAGGNYISSNTGLYLGTGGGGTSTFTISSGSALITTLRMNATTATVNLDGGTLQANVIDVQGGTNTFNFNGGTLVAGASSTTFMQGLDAANVRDGGAVIDTDGKVITIAQALLHSSIGGDAGTDGGLTKTGSNTLILSGANTYTGATNINAGVLRIKNASALGGTTAGTTVASGARIELADNIAVSGESLTISGSGGNSRGALQTQSGANTWAGNVTLGANETRIGAVGAGNSLTISGAIGDGGANRTLAIRNDGGTTILSGANTYGGNTDVVIGLLKIDGGDNRLPTGTVVRMGYTEGSDVSTFDLNGWNQQVAGLLARATTTTTIVTNSSATPSILTVNNSGNYSYSGLVTGNLALTKTGTGTLTLSGENTYTGATNVNAGVLRINNASALGGTAAGTTVADGARIELAGGITVSGESLTISGSGGNNCGALQTQTGANTWAGNVTLGANNTRIGAVGAGTSLTVSGAIGDGGNNHALAIYNDGGTTVLSGTNTYSGGTTVSNGILRITKNSALGTGQTTVSVGAQLELSGGITVSDQTIRITGYGASGYGALRSLDGYNVWDGPVYFEDSNSRVGAVNSDSVLEISGEIRDGTSNKVVTVRNNLGKTIFSGVNTYTGETRIYNGTLELGAHDSLPVGNPLLLGIGSLDPTFDLKGFNQTIGSLRSEGNGAHTITNTGDFESTLTVAQNSNEVFGGTIANGTSPLHLTKAGGSQLTLSGANTYTGLTTVNAGTLLVTGSLANKGSSHVQVASAGTAFGSADPTIIRTVAAGGTFAGLGSQITGSGTLGTQADLMAGSNGSGGSLDVAMAWRTFDSAETAAFAALTNPVSDIVQLTGMGTGETDPFVLQMSYSSSLVQPYHDGLFLAWLSPTDGWVNAVEGNSGTGASAVAGATGSWDSIVDAGDLASYLGSWGIDSTGGTAWAVLNHNSQFAVLAVPEPSSLLLGCMGLVGLLLAVRRRRS